MERVKTKFSVSLLYMLEYCKTMLSHFTDEQAQFETFDADFATPFETNWQDAIDTAEDILPDEAVQDQLQQLTADVDSAMEAARQKFADSRYFIEKAFPSKPAVQKEFGMDDYRDARKSQKGMTQFMQTFFKTATKYAAELAAVNYNAAAVAEIQTLGTTLNDANIAQEKFKGTRWTITETRIVAHNAAWDVMLQVSKAGKVIFQKSPAKYQWFLLPASSESGEDISINGTVTDGSTNTALQDVVVGIASLGIETTTDSNGKYVFGNLASGTYSLLFSADGYAPTTQENVVVSSGDTTEIDVTLNPVAGGLATVSGTVSYASPFPPADKPTVSFNSVNGPVDATVNNNGTYILQVSPLLGSVSGSLEVKAIGFMPQMRPITLSPGDVREENFSMSPMP